MPPTVYLETSVVSYLAAEPSTNVIVAGSQAVTRDWWSHRSRFDIVVSQLVVHEVSAGDPDQASKRLQIISGLPLLDLSPEAQEIAASLLEHGTLPQKALNDALHIALAAANGVQYLVTWNCRHIANAFIRPKIEEALRLQGYEPPTICTPQELSDG